MLDNVIGQVHKGVSTRSTLNQFCEHMTLFHKLNQRL